MNFLHDYARVNLSRYLIGHWGLAAYRHLIFRKYAITHKQLLLGYVIEPLFLYLAISIFISLQWLSRHYVFFNNVSISLGYVSLVIIVFSFFFSLISGFLLRWMHCESILSRLKMMTLLKIGSCYLSYFAIFGALMFFLVNQEASFVKLTSSYSMSWLAGSLAPGVVQGIGVREALFVKTMGTNSIIFLEGIIFIRILSVFVDMLIFFFSWIPLKKKAVSN